MRARWRRGETGGVGSSAGVIVVLAGEVRVSLNFTSGLRNGLIGKPDGKCTALDCMIKACCFEGDGGIFVRLATGSVDSDMHGNEALVTGAIFVGDSFMAARNAASFIDDPRRFETLANWLK